MNSISETQEIQTQKGKIVTIMLRANPSSGYEWIPEFDPTAIELISKEFVPINNLIGGDTSQKFEFKALASGETKLRLICKRAWETKETDEKTYIFRVT